MSWSTSTTPHPQAMLTTNPLVTIRGELPENMQGATEVLSYGAAVVVEQD